MDFGLILWSMIFSMAITGLMAPDLVTNAQKDAPDANVNAPSIAEGTSITLIGGSSLLARQAVVWYGGLGATAYETTKTRGFKYRITGHLNLCWGPIDDVLELRFDDIIVPTTSYSKTVTAEYIDFAINAPDLFGGDDQEGGIVGTVRVYRGTLTQTYDTELATLIGSALPAYRRCAYAVLRDVYIGNSPRLKAMSLLIRCTPDALGLGNGHHAIGIDENPINFIYRILNDSTYGAGIPADGFDLPAWQAAAETVYAEGVGISPQLAQSSDIEATIQDLKRYVDGEVFEDPTTGLVSIRLIREVDLSGAIVLTDQQVVSVQAERLGWPSLRNTVKASYTDRSRNYNTGQVMARNTAVARAIGGAIDLSQEDLSAFASAGIAQKAAERLNRAASYPLMKVEIVGNRALAQLSPARAFHLTWVDPPISTYFRVVRVIEGRLGSGQVVVNAVEDVFAAAAGTFAPPPGSAFTPPTGSTAKPTPGVAMLETPYLLQGADTRSVAFGAISPDAMHTGFRVRLNGAPSTATEYGFMARAPLPAVLEQWTGEPLTLTLTLPTLPADIVTPNATQFDAGQALLLVDRELLSYRTITRNPNGTVTFGGVGRGALDTVPRRHAAQAQVYVLSSLRYRPALALTTDQAVSVGAVTATATDVQPDYLATTATLTTESRAARPVPPALLSIGGVPYPGGTVAYPARLSWLPRTKLAGQVLLQTTTGQTAEPGTDYVIRVYDSTGAALLNTYTTSTASYQLPDYGSIVVTVNARKSGLESWQAQSVAITVSPPLRPSAPAVLALAGQVPAVSQALVMRVGGPAVLEVVGQAPVKQANGYRFWRLAIDQWAVANNPGTSGDTRVAEMRYYTAASVKWPTEPLTGGVGFPTTGQFTASASSSNSSFPAQYAFNDEDSDSRRWISGSGGGAQWLQIDMGEPVTFTSFSISPDGAASLGYYITQFRILASATGAFAGEETQMFATSGLTGADWSNLTPKSFTM